MRPSLFGCLPNSGYSRVILVQQVSSTSRLATLPHMNNDTRGFPSMPNSVLSRVRPAQNDSSASLLATPSHIKTVVKNIINDDFGRSNKHSGTYFYAPQTKILESRTNISDRVFKALFAYVSTSVGRLTIEKCFENKVRDVCSDFQNLLFGRVKVDKDAVNRHFSFSRCVKFLEIYGPQTKISERRKICG